MIDRVHEVNERCLGSVVTRDKHSARGEREMSQLSGNASMVHADCNELKCGELMM